VRGGGPLGSEEGGWETIAPSALPFDSNWPAPRAMTEDDINEVTAAFIASARRARRIGFDLVELHVAHGYLLHQFLSPLELGLPMCAASVRAYIAGRHQPLIPYRHSANTLRAHLTALSQTAGGSFDRY
jgi:NADH:flavin oxidoreductase / NADH oxidase family